MAVQVEIYKLNTDEERLPNGVNFIDELKHLREYLKARYGDPGGLREGKEFLEHIMRLQMERRKPISVHRNEVETLRALVRRAKLSSSTFQYHIADIEDHINKMFDNK